MKDDRGILTKRYIIKLNNMEKKKKEKDREIHLAVLKQMVKLSTSGFGLVAALAWNNLIQELVNSYIKPHLPQGSTIISLLLYALLVTVLAVLVTYNLTRLAEKVEELNDRIRNRRRSRDQDE